MAARFYMVQMCQILEKFLDFLIKKKLSKKISNQDQLINCVIKYINSKNNSKKIIKDLHLIGMNILNKTYKEINK